MEVFHKINAFKDSEEERLLKKVLKNIIESDKSVINLVIDSCNGKRGCTFSEASVELAPYVHEDFYADDFGLIPMKLLFKLCILEDFVGKGVDSAMDDKERAAAYLTIMEFIQERRMHGKAIKEISQTSDETSTSLTVALAQHLFSQLIPNKNYLVDGMAEKLPEKCPHCQANIEAGNTSLGSAFTWHGRAEVLVNETMAVRIVKEDSSQNEGTDENFGEDLDPEVKKRRSETEELPDTKTEICLECGDANKNVLLDLHTIDKVVAEAITNSFAQVNTKKSLDDLFIPTFSCSSDCVSVFLYHPTKDILLESTDLLNLWNVTFTENLLSLHTVVWLWLFLNFTTFMVSGTQLEENVKLDKSKFHEYMKDRLKFYQNLETGMPFCVKEAQRPVSEDLKLYCYIRQPRE
ncbi:uncharacterized protein [Argopecten irradians]|uniref:uncharacterized protein n=1 Tax=Argopecten irradians TaxID=31199 RepID=UPI003717A784